MTADEATGNLPVPVEPSGALTELSRRVLESLDVGTREVFVPAANFSLVTRLPALGDELSEFALSPVRFGGHDPLAERYAARF